MSNPSCIAEENLIESQFIPIDIEKKKYILSQMECICKVQQWKRRNRLLM